MKKKVDYKGFCLHLKEYDRLNIAYGMNDLIRLAKKYNTPIPKSDREKVMHKTYQHLTSKNRCPDCKYYIQQCVEGKACKLDKCKYKGEFKMNLPFHRIHDCQSSYGYLILPIFWKKDRYNKIKWLGYFDDYGIRITDKFGFHNCNTTGIF